MTSFLKISQFSKDNGVPKMDIRAGGIDAELYPQRAICAQFLRQFHFADDLRGAAGESCKLIAHIMRTKNSARAETTYLFLFSNSRTSSIVSARSWACNAFWLFPCPRNGRLPAKSRVAYFFVE